jgi:ABC-2 type transport system permease protein
MTVEAPAPEETIDPPIDYAALGRPIAGPRAFTGDWRRFWHLVFNTAVAQWKLRFFGSALGYLWQLVRPLLLFAVLYVFFTKVAQVNDTGKPAEAHDGAQLLASIVLFTFFNEATMGAVRSVVDNEALVRKIQFPRMVIPLSTVLVACFNLGLNLVVVGIFTLASGVRPMWTWFEVFPIIALLIVLATGLALLLSALFVFLRDVQPIWEVLSQIVFYASPVIVAVDKVQEYLHGTLFHLYMLNPLAVIFQQFRHAVITHAAPSVGNLLGSQAQIAEPVAIVVAIFFLGLYVFNRMAPKVAEDL